MKKARIIIALSLLLSLLAGCAAAAGTESTSEPSSVAAESTAPGDAGEILVSFTDGGITASAAENLEMDGTALTITGAGTYVLSGSCANGSVKVKKGVTGVRLVLSSLHLSSESTAPILCGKGTQVTIEAAAGTESTLADTEKNSDGSGNVDAENAVIKCKDGSAVVLCGSGTLNLQANGKNGIKSGASTTEDGDAALTIRDLTLNIDAPVNDAINAEAALAVESGSLTISAADDALHCDCTLTIGAEGTDGPDIMVASCYEGLEGAAVNVLSGNISILSTDDCINAANSDLTGYDFALNISGGTIVACSDTGDGFDSNGDLTISGGTVTVWTGSTADNEPLDADGKITVSGGTVLAAGGSSGMGMNLEAAQPCVIFGGSGAAEMPGGFLQPGQGGAPGGNSQADRNPGQEGQSGGEARPGQGSFPGAQASLLKEGSAFTLCKEDGTVLYTADAACSASYLFFSSGDLASGESYTLCTEDSQTESSAQSGTIVSGMGGGQRPEGPPPTGGFGSQKQDGSTPPEQPGGSSGTV